MGFKHADENFRLPVSFFPGSPPPSPLCLNVAKCFFSSFCSCNLDNTVLGPFFLPPVDFLSHLLVDSRPPCPPPRPYNVRTWRGQFVWNSGTVSRFHLCKFFSLNCDIFFTTFWQLFAGCYIPTRENRRLENLNIPAFDSCTLDCFKKQLRTYPTGYFPTGQCQSVIASNSILIVMHDRNFSFIRFFSNFTQWTCKFLHSWKRR